MSIDILGEMADFTFTSKYAKHQEKLSRRETWIESADRSLQMHLKKFDFLDADAKAELSWAFDMVKAKMVTPSMRSMQFGGIGIEHKNQKMFNCSVRHINSLRSFAESFHLLLNGCGVGFGLNKRFLSQIPNLVSAEDKTGAVITYTIDDTIEGWADSVEVLLMCYSKNTPFSGKKIVFDYSKIRKKGSPLKKSGGKAPGHEGLKNAHGKIKALLDHIIEDLGLRRMRSIDAYDILMHCADATLSGGIRRSACSVVFELDDDDMMNAKTFFKVDSHKRFVLDKETGRYHGMVTVNNKKYVVDVLEYDYKQIVEDGKISWFYIEPQRARSNNSVILLRDKCSIELFKSIIERTRQFGEPNFVFANNEYCLFNPCFAGDQKVLTTEGWKKFTELVGSTVGVIQDNRALGTYNPETEKEEWEVDVKNVGTSVNTASHIRMTDVSKSTIKITFTCGRELTCTPDHLIATTEGMFQAKDIMGKKVLVAIPQTYTPDTSSIEYKIGMLSGLFSGDGTTLDGSVCLDLWLTEDEKSDLGFFQSLVDEVLQHVYGDNRPKSTENQLNPKFKECPANSRPTYKKYRICSKLLTNIFSRYKSNTKGDISWLYNLSKDFKSGFVTGLTYADGHIEITKHQSLSVRIGQSNLPYLQDLMLILQELGVMSRIYNLLPEGDRPMPDGKGGSKLYFCKQSYRLSVGGLANCQAFCQAAPIHGEKSDRMAKAFKTFTKKSAPHHITKVASIVDDKIQDVYCLQENNRRIITVSGIVSARCFEIAFLPIFEDIASVQFCNLTTQNGKKITSLDIFKQTSIAAAIIGTCQAAFTQFDYLANSSVDLTKDEALLGVSITGMMDNPDVLLNPDNQRICANLVNETNRRWAKILGIKPAARTTCIKPEGTSSIVLESGSGIHPHHAKRYIRRIQCNKLDPVYKHFRKSNPHACEPSVWSANHTDDVVSFPVTLSDKVMVKKDLTAIKHLEIIKSTQQNWVLPGSRKEENKKDIDNNVSCTVIVKDDEWDDVINYVFENREFFTAISFLPDTGDKIYAQAPNEAIVTEEDEAKFQALLDKWVKVDYTKLKETDDATNLRAELVCSGGACEVVRMD